ncbi:anaphase-promoting complex, cyclosome, subunit 4-domain-containing protein [Halteromyces radiatus]|uniref:anaphase-promoting complex, cyclosome, subunit 4-domain-containing protein n=1 Tax=Halteromyces radiatus TaxID=101107 RepID=UPI002220B5CC|nr:anaphase-promoting complex, cyclosome, subunit 4-domain-containing protein [Halteromyces radiatus]KAI8081313.1 anaphase-promoting complex, cyclosome, subunit 4-domain-containing protein [Halteromyces radiatus]
MIYIYIFISDLYYYSLNAGYHIGTIRCTQQISKGSIKNISLSQNDSTIQILIQHTGTANYEMVTLNSQFLQSKKLPLCNVATIERQINYLLQYIHQCTKALEAHRTVYATLAKRNVERISDIVKQGNSELLPLPHIELLGLLVTGNLNGALPEYFSEEMTQQKATQWETKSLHSYSRIQRIIIEYLQPASERLLLNLSQLHGYGLWTERYSDLLCSDTITTAIELTRHYLWITQQLLQDTGKASRRFEEFIKWIVRVVQKIADQGQTDYMNNPSGPLYQNPNLIVDYLLKDFGFDSLACYFDDIDQNSPLTMEIDEPQTIKNDVSSSNITRSLRSAYNDMAKHCKTILEEPANTMSHLITPLDTIHLDLSPTINADKSLHTFSNETPGRNEAARLIESKVKKRKKKIEKQQIFDLK